MWETEALRSSPQRIAESETDGTADTTDAGRWVTLREANRATGIPVETLRKWARREAIPTYLTPTSAGTNIRMVDLQGVEQRAADLGRAIAPATDSPSSPDRGAATPAAAPDPAPAGTMIVPIDAWNKMLNQLGNLHDAGQQLAIARERAAKAETEAKFLRERLAEMRDQPNAEPSAPAPPSPGDAPSVAPAEPTPPAPPEKVWHYLVRRVRDRRLG